MTFREGARLDPTRVRRRGQGSSSGRRGMAAGGGIGGLILLLLAAFFGLDLGGVDSSGGGSAVTSADETETQAEFNERCSTGAAANEYLDCRIAGAANSLDTFWAAALPTVGHDLDYPGIVVFDVSTSTPCGTASSQTGPFYCPSDETIYTDTTFFNKLTEDFGANGGPLAEMYVLAHEYGHHIENQLGVFDIANRGDTGPDSDSVKVELMADCLAGLWTGHASKVPDADGNVLLLPFTKQDIKDALSAASAVGDDNIQETIQGHADPHTYTHGTSEERALAFETGYNSGSVNSCDLFGVTG